VTTFIFNNKKKNISNAMRSPRELDARSLGKRYLVGKPIAGFQIMQQSILDFR
jgi:hypothetical protein